MHSRYGGDYFKILACVFIFYPLFFVQSFSLQFIIQLAFISAGCILILIHNTPYLEERFIPYGLAGSRLSGQNGKGPQVVNKGERVPKVHLLNTLLDCLAAIRVPHAWFRHFYTVSLLSSIFWGHQLLTNGPVFASISKLAETDSYRSNTPLYRVIILWLLLFIQGCRRLYESYAYDKKSRSQMWVGHWVMGIAFYLAVNVAVWIDGTRAINSWHRQPWRAGTVEDQRSGFHANHEYAQSASYINIVDLREVPTVAFFMIHSVMQNSIHRFLATLPSTSRKPPTQGLFAGTLCPHYGYEVLIYFDLAFGWGMPGSSQTMNAVLRFVIVNLFISARQKQKWYRKQFGDASIKGRSLMSTARWSDILETILGSLIPEL